MTGVLRFEIQHGIFQERSLFPQQQMGSELVLELGKVKAVRKRSGAYLSYTVASTIWLSNDHFHHRLGLLLSINWIKTGIMLQWMHQDDIKYEIYKK